MTQSIQNTTDHLTHSQSDDSKADAKTDIKRDSKSASATSTPNTLRVVELFAGVGGFRVGLEQVASKQAFDIVWSNQWEPSTKIQHASNVYAQKFGSDNHSNQDIETVPTSDIPNHDLMVGGFPCQDYSVATTLKNSKGLKGKKGVLWWSIHRILEDKGEEKPKYLMFENVDRLLKSPASQRGRDFAIILQCLNQLGYAVEWRVINAAEYGMPQRRRRVFFLGYHHTSEIYQKLIKTEPMEWLVTDGVIATSFPVAPTDTGSRFVLQDDLVDMSENFNKNAKTSPFANTGLMIDGRIVTTKTMPKFTGSHTVLGDVLQADDVPAAFYIKDASLKNAKTIKLQDGTEKVIATEKQMWTYLKGAKREYRKTKEGFEYHYSEGGMIFPDALDNASRTIITGEGGKSPSRFKHVIETDKGLRRLTPLELERLNMFPDNHTKIEGVTDTKRAFFMGNALVVGVVEKLGQGLYSHIRDCDNKTASL